MSSLFRFMHGLRKCKDFLHIHNFLTKTPTILNLLISSINSAHTQGTIKIRGLEL